MNNGFKWKVGSPSYEDWASVVEYLAEIRKRIAEDDEQ